MRRPRLVIGISLIVLAIGGAGAWFGAQGRYFAKDPWTHAGVVVGAICGLSLLFAASEWLQTRRKG